MVMPIMKFLALINQPTKTDCMKATLIMLCVIFCFVIFGIYPKTTNLTSFPNDFTNRIGLFLSLHGTSAENSTVSVTNTSEFPRRNLSVSNRQFAIFACSIHSSVQAYLFYTPVTAASWLRVGYEVIVVFVGDFTHSDASSARFNLSRNYLKRVGAHIIDVQCNASYATKISQLVRVFAGFLPDSIVNDDDNILTSDSDLLPLKPGDYRPTSGTDGFIFNAFCCGTFNRRGKSYRMFPMGHVYLKKKDWRGMIMESKLRSELLVNATNQTLYLLSKNAPFTFETISTYARHEFKNVYDSNMVKGDSAWYMDQILCSMLLIDYRETHTDFKISERGRGGRLDRANGIGYWNRNDFSPFGDAHLIHDSILDKNNWKIFNKLLKFLFNETTVSFLNDYYQQYMLADQLSKKQKN